MYLCQNIYWLLQKGFIFATAFQQNCSSLVSSMASQITSKECFPITNKIKLCRLPFPNKIDRPPPRKKHDSSVIDWKPHQNKRFDANESQEIDSVVTLSRVLFSPAAHHNINRSMLAVVILKVKSFSQMYFLQAFM